MVRIEKIMGVGSTVRLQNYEHSRNSGYIFLGKMRNVCNGHNSQGRLTSKDQEAKFLDQVKFWSGEMKGMLDNNDKKKYREKEYQSNLVLRRRLIGGGKGVQPRDLKFLSQLQHSYVICSSHGE